MNTNIFQNDRGGNSHKCSYAEQIGHSSNFPEVYLLKEIQLLWNECPQIMKQIRESTRE